MEKMNIAASSDRLDEVQSFLEEAMESAEISMGTMFKVSVAAEEAFINIADYAYGDESGDAEISIDISFEDGKKTITLIFADSGREFNPLQVSEPKEGLLEDESVAGGLGIFMIRKMMDRVNYEFAEGQNRLTMQCIDAQEGL